MDFHLPDGNGLDYTRQILQQYPQLKIVFLTTSVDDAHRPEIDASGAVGHLRKNTPVGDLLSYIHDLKRGETTYSRSG
jgi:DNA-binding NarL/FixJ family response regulator